MEGTLHGFAGSLPNLVVRLLVAVVVSHYSLLRRGALIVRLTQSAPLGRFRLSPT